MATMTSFSPEQQVYIQGHADRLTMDVQALIDAQSTLGLGWESFDDVEHRQSAAIAGGVQPVGIAPTSPTIGDMLNMMMQQNECTTSADDGTKEADVYSGVGRRRR